MKLSFPWCDVDSEEYYTEEQRRIMSVKDPDPLKWLIAAFRVSSKMADEWLFGKFKNSPMNYLGFVEHQSSHLPIRLKFQNPNTLPRRWQTLMR